MSASLLTSCGVCCTRWALLASMCIPLVCCLDVQEGMFDLGASPGDVRSTLPQLGVHLNVAAVECSLRCIMNKNCGGVNFRGALMLGDCEMVDGKAGGALIAATGYNYFENDGYDECLSNQCLNGATCIDGYNSYTCICVSGFTDINCETNIDDCPGNGCLQGSTCVDGLNSYTCLCRPGFSGDYCQICPVMKKGPNCDQECTLTTIGTEYNGTAKVSENGRTCQRWDADFPHIHDYDDNNMFPEGSANAASNYCRNPQHPTKALESRPWCYTVWVFYRWEYCDIPLC